MTLSMSGPFTRAEEPAETARAPAAPHTYAAEGTYHVTVQVTAQWGNIGPTTATIIVDKVPPTATITGAPVSGHSPEGTAITLGSTVTDPSTVDTAAGFTYSWTV